MERRELLRAGVVPPRPRDGAEVGERRVEAAEVEQRRAALAAREAVPGIVGEERVQERERVVEMAVVDGERRLPLARLGGVGEGATRAGDGRPQPRDVAALVALHDRVEQRVERGVVGSHGQTAVEKPPSGTSSGLRSAERMAPTFACTPGRTKFT